MAPVTLHQAAGAGNIQKLQDLLRHLPVDVMDEAGLRPALSYACEKGQLAAASFLLDRGAEVNFQSDYDGSTALSWACYKGHVDVVRLLLERGAGPSVRDEEGATALVDAVAGGDDEAQQEIARLLLARPNVDVNARDELGRTALHSAFYFGRVQLSTLLLVELGAIHDVRDAHGQTPRQLAEDEDAKRRRDRLKCVRLYEWYEGELERAYLLTKLRALVDAKAVIDHASNQARSCPTPTAALEAVGHKAPEYLRGRVKGLLPLPDVSIQDEEGKRRPMRRWVLAQVVDKGLRQDPFRTLMDMMRYR